MLRFDHRVSKDIDICAYDAQALGFLSPRLNELAAQESNTYQEQSNAVRLAPFQGDIDFIVAGTLLPSSPIEIRHEQGRLICLDSTAEILANKLL